MTFACAGEKEKQLVNDFTYVPKIYSFLFRKNVVIGTKKDYSSHKIL